jgi:hypothetical protein
VLLEYAVLLVGYFTSTRVLQQFVEEAASRQVASPASCGSGGVTLTRTHAQRSFVGDRAVGDAEPLRPSGPTPTSAGAGAAAAPVWAAAASPAAAEAKGDGGKQGKKKKDKVVLLKFG